MGCCSSTPRTLEDGTSRRKNDKKRGGDVATDGNNNNPTGQSLEDGGNGETTAAEVEGGGPLRRRRSTRGKSVDPMAASSGDDDSSSEDEDGENYSSDYSEAEGDAVGGGSSRRRRRRGKNAKDARTRRVSRHNSRQQLTTSSSPSDEITMMSSDYFRNRTAESLKLEFYELGGGGGAATATASPSSNQSGSAAAASTAEQQQQQPYQHTDDWFVAYCNATSAQPRAFMAGIVDAAAPEVRAAIANMTAADAATKREGSGDAKGTEGEEKEKHAAAASSLPPSPADEEEASKNERPRTPPTAIISEQQLFLWKRYGFANLPKEGFASLDAAFYNFTRKSDTMSNTNLSNFRRKLGKHVERDEHFIFLMATLNLCGRDEEFKQSSPSRVRQNFRISEWSLNVQTWRAGWLGIDVLSWRDAKHLLPRLAAQFDRLSLASDKFLMVVRFAYMFSKKDPSLGTMGKETAIKLWLDLFSRKWSMTHDWIKFVSSVEHWDKSHVTQDQWEQLPAFAVAFPTKKTLVCEFDPDTSFWPSLMDAFASHLIEKEGENFASGRRRFRLRRQQQLQQQQLLAGSSVATAEQQPATPLVTRRQKISEIGNDDDEFEDGEDGAHNSHHAQDDENASGGGFTAAGISQASLHNNHNTTAALSANNNRNPERHAGERDVHPLGYLSHNVSVTDVGPSSNQRLRRNTQQSVSSTNHAVMSDAEGMSMGGGESPVVDGSTSLGRHIA